MEPSECLMLRISGHNVRNKAENSTLGTPGALMMGTADAQGLKGPCSRCRYPAELDAATISLTVCVRVVICSSFTADPKERDAAL